MRRLSQLNWTSRLEDWNLAQIVADDPAVQITIRLLLERAGHHVTVKMATKLGAAASLRKPFRPEVLLAAVDGCLAVVRSSPPRQSDAGTSPMTATALAHHEPTCGVIPDLAGRST